MEQCSPHQSSFYQWSSSSTAWLFSWQDGLLFDRHPLCTFPCNITNTRREGVKCRGVGTKTNIASSCQTVMVQSHWMISELPISRWDSGLNSYKKFILKLLASWFFLYESCKKFLKTPLNKKGGKLFYKMEFSLTLLFGINFDNFIPS